MEFFLLVFLIIILIILLNIKTGISARIMSLEAKVEALLDELKRSRSQRESPEKKSMLEEIMLQHRAQEVRPEIKPEPKKEPEVIQEPAIKEKEIVPEVKTPGIITYPDVISAAPVTPEPALMPAPEPKPGFFERNPDLEKFIGENLANKIGIGVLVLGIGFFVKYAIDKDWINEIGRVFIGILCGGILLGVAHRLRKSFAAFSSVLVGGGIAVLYLTIAIAFHEYHIFNQTAAFILMLIITAFAVLLSLAYNRIELAILSILGGFASPFMVSTGEGNYAVLFTYILILDSGMLVLAYYKKWNPVNIISYGFTLLLFGSWLGTGFKPDNTSMVAGALIFATLFYVVFFAMNIINNVKERTTFKALEISLLLSNTFFYYGAGMFILNSSHGEAFRGLFTASLGVFNFIFAYILYRSNRVDRNLVFLLIGLVLTFISLAAPVQLEGNYITLFWSAETVLLLWLSQKSGIRLMKLASVLLMGLMLISLLMDWEQLYFTGTESLRIILNKAYITGIFVLASIAITYRLLKNEKTENQEHVDFYKSLLIFGGVVLLYFSQLLELRHQLYAYGFEFETQNIIIGCYNMVFILVLIIAERRMATMEMVRILFSFWGIVAMLLYLAFYHSQVINVRNSFILADGPVTGFLFHYVLITLIVAITFLSLPRIQGLRELNQQTYNVYSWFHVFFFVFLASAELDHTVLLAAQATQDSMDHILSQNHKIGFPILWGISSFVLIFTGLKTRKKHLRIISLTLFLITLLKLFTVDIRGISEGGKIAAFISLGILLLIVSFMYQRLKKILLADETASENNGQA